MSENRIPILEYKKVWDFENKNCPGMEHVLSCGRPIIILGRKKKMDASTQTEEHVICTPDLQDLLACSPDT